MSPKFKVGDKILSDLPGYHWFEVVGFETYNRQMLNELSYKVKDRNGNHDLWSIELADQQCSLYMGEGYQDTTQTFYESNPSPELLAIAELVNDKVLVPKFKVGDKVRWYLPSMDCIGTVLEIRRPLDTYPKLITYLIQFNDETTPEVTTEDKLIPISA